jgi:hypothetical protein
MDLTTVVSQTEQSGRQMVTISAIGITPLVSGWELGMTPMVPMIASTGAIFNGQSKSQTISLPDGELTTLSMLSNP